jgi:hypothetical protein
LKKHGSTSEPKKQKQWYKIGERENNHNTEKLLGALNIWGLHSETLEIKTTILAANNTYYSLQTILRSKQSAKIIK